MYVWSVPLEIAPASVLVGKKGSGVWGLGFGVLGFGVWVLGFGVSGSRFGVQGLKVWGLGKRFGVWGLGPVGVSRGILHL